MPFTHKHLLGIADLTKKEISFILDTAESFKEISEREIKKVPTLRGKTVINFFYEPSTRTRTSFEIAAKRMSADAINISASGSSIVKGESLRDMAKNLEAMRPDIIVLRHPVPGAPYILSQSIKASIINAGDGAHEHPTQALLDLLTIRGHKGRIEGLTITIIGDIAHSRVARSNIHGLTKMGATVNIAGPTTFIPPGIEKMGVCIYTNMEEAIKEADIIMMLRVQFERQGNKLLPSVREYAHFFCLNPERLKAAKKDVLIMHPGPINRGIEIDPQVADSECSLILDQVTNGIAVRMALLYLLTGGQ
ncbi:MAG: aspartate carbamoyltransferase catalytic subunit [bacterium]